ncbi:Hypothetical predicted protein [Paramuricea clavata]|uniref:Uncharacterized protein n=1 Tax=Paramuricea clavata TaxID=317549 RepID=A0A7D9I1Q3_PARCT|nr:Hypothetical predicted protein [Paramuricea clavata]
MDEAYSIAQDKIKEKGIKAKRSYDRWVRSSVLEPGDRMLVRNLTERGGPGKLRPFWGNDIYVVVNRKGPESPVYETKRENVQDEEASSDEDFSDVVMVSPPRETRSAQSRNPLPTDEAVPDNSDNLAVDDNLETLELQTPTETEETLDLSGEQSNLNPVHDIPTIPVVENPRPQRH